MNLQLTLHDDEQATGKFQVTDRKGNADPTAAPLAWTIEDATVASLSVSADGSTPTITGQKPGQTAAHAVSGAFTLDVAITVLAGADTGITGSFGDPTPQDLPDVAKPGTGV